MLELVHNVAGFHVDADTHLIDSGVDSLGVVELRNQLQKTLRLADAMPNTLVFDYPTPRQLVTHLPSLASGLPTALQQFADTMAVRSQHGRLNGGLLRLKDGDQRLVPLFGVPGLFGTASVIAPITPHLDCTVYALESEYLNTGAPAWLKLARHVETLASEHARVAIAECTVTFCAPYEFNLMGSSFGSMLAHQVACQALRLGGAPGKLVLLDPFPMPPYAYVPPIQNAAWCAAELEITYFRVMQTDDSSGQKEVFAEEVHAAYSAVSDDELGVLLTSRLAAKGLMPFTPDVVLANTRKIRVFQTHQHTVADVSISAIEPYTAGPILMAVASARAEFYEDVFHVAAEECAADKLMAWGSQIEEMVHVEGQHMEVCSRCETGRVPSFTESLIRFLLDSNGSSM